MVVVGTDRKGTMEEKVQFLDKQHGNCERREVLVFIACKHAEHKVQKQIIDPRMHMIPALQR